MGESRTIRWAVCERVLEILDASSDLEGVQVEAGFPGDRLEDEAIWFDETDGQINIPVSKGADNVAARDDKFDVTIEFRVAGKASQREARARLDEIIGAFELGIARDTQIGQLDGVVVAGVTEGRETSGEFPGGGAVAFGERTLSVHAAWR